MTQTAVDLDALIHWMRSFPSVLVAYSGGVDSALVMAAAHRALGEKSLACIGVSPSLPQRELEQALKVAGDLGAACRVIQTHEADNPDYAANPANRCYFCKSELYDRLTSLAKDEGWSVILDGNNASDLMSNDRPGRSAAAERGVRSPLAELGITKDQVRTLARELGLPVWDKPAMACLSSRVPTGTPITPGLLSQIEQAENVLASLGFKQYRVRHHGQVARIEIPIDDLPQAIAHRQILVDRIKALGYRFVTLDLAGFRSGSLSSQ